MATNLSAQFRYQSWCFDVNIPSDFRVDARLIVTALDTAGGPLLACDDFSAAITTIWGTQMHLMLDVDNNDFVFMDVSHVKSYLSTAIITLIPGMC